MENPTRVLSFTDHLEELRVRLIICVAFFVVTFLLGFMVSPKVVEWLIRPLTQLQTDLTPENTLTLTMTQDGNLHWNVPRTVAGAVDTTKALAAIARDRLAIKLPVEDRSVVVGARSSSNLFFLSPIEPFMLLVKGALLVSAIFSFPMIIYQGWLFIAPGLKRKERRVARPVLLASLILFPVGAGFAYLIAHIALKVLIGFGDNIPGLQPNIVASKYLGFLLTLMLAFGIVFEFPLILVLLSRIGVVDADLLVKRRKWAIVILSVVAAVATPTPDPFTMTAMLLPLLALYEASIWAMRAMEKAGGPVPQRRFKWGASETEDTEPVDQDSDKVETP